VASVDLNTLMGDWTYEPGRLAVRKIIAKDGAVRIQMRMDLGVAQFDYAGRPDGRRPFTCASLLEYHQRRLAEHIRFGGTDAGFALAPQESAELVDELALYYQRYVCLFVLEELERVAGDVEHGLAIIAFCERYVRGEKARQPLTAFKPYLILMKARALAVSEVNRANPEAALAHVNRGLYALYAHYCAEGRTSAYRTSAEVEVLEQLRLSVGHLVDGSRSAQFRRELRAAIREERFEDAALLRDILQIDARR
jgi:hypothetical protein